MGIWQTMDRPRRDSSRLNPADGGGRTRSNRASSQSIGASAPVGAAVSGHAAASARLSPSARLHAAKARRNRRHTGPFWTRLPSPVAIAKSIGRGFRRALPTLIATSVAAAGVTGVFFGYRFITRSPHFAITSIDIRGTHNLSIQAVQAQLPVHLGENIFVTNIGRVTQTLEHEPWIAHAEIHRELPHTLVIDVRERAPVAIAQLGELYLIDENGTPFKRLDVTDDHLGLPVITGISREVFDADPKAGAAVLRDSLAALTRWGAVAGAGAVKNATIDGPASRPVIGEVHVDPRHRLTLLTADDAVAIRLGALDSAQLPDRMGLFDRAWNHLSPDERHRARAIHLDNDTRPDHVIVAFAED